MKFLTDIAPLLVFFAAYKFYGLIYATVAIVVVTISSLIYTYIKERKIAMVPLISGIILVFFGGLTVALNDERFIKIKPTLVNVLFAAILFGGALANKPIMKYIMGHAITMTDKAWKTLSLRWGFFFVAMAGLNEFVWRSFDTDLWVKFKVFGLLGLTFGFILTQMPFLKKHAEPIIENKEES